MSQPPAENQIVNDLVVALRERSRLIQSRPSTFTALPLCDQFTKWLQSLPEPAKQAARTVPELQALFKGRRGGPPSANELGVLLRSLGWTRARQWAGNEQPFRRFWVPPRTRST